MKRQSTGFVAHEGVQRVPRVRTPRPPCPACGNKVCTCVEDALAGQMRYIGLPVPQREYVFWPGRKWRFDFAWVNRKIAVECEGGTWSGGRHVRGGGYQEDCIKYNHAAIAGWRVLRVTAEMVGDGSGLTLIEMAVGKQCR